VYLRKNNIMKLRFAFHIGVLSAVGMLTGCDRDKSSASADMTNPPVTGRDVAGKYKDAAIATKDYAVQDKDAVVAATEKKMKDLDAKLDHLSAQAADLKDDAKVQADKALTALREQRNIAATKYHELKTASDEAWEKAKEGFAEAWTNVETAYTNAKAKFN
jgi:hypothetical protein